MTIQTNEPSHYFNLHVSGLGYVNRIREVKVKRGEPFWACELSALHGAQDAIQYTKFDCRVSGNVAETWIKKLINAEQENKKILIGFKLGDLYADVFTYEQGSKKGETGVSLKARLLFIAWIKVDGVCIYLAPPANHSSDTPAEASDSAHHASEQCAAGEGMTVEA
jgi:hypothetical protein